MAGSLPICYGSDFKLRVQGSVNNVLYLLQQSQHCIIPTSMTYQTDDKSGTGVVWRSSVVNDTGKTRLLHTLQRAQAGGSPSVGQWMEFPGYTLAKTIAGLGADVCWISHVVLKRHFLMTFTD